MTTTGYVLIRDKRVNVSNVDYYESYNYTDISTGQIGYTVRIMYNCAEKHTFEFPTEELRDAFLAEFDKLMGVDPVLTTF